MSWNDHFYDDAKSEHLITCRCGAKYQIYEDDGVPGCRDVESVYCEYCGKEIARRFGSCDGKMIDDHDVAPELKEIKRNFDSDVMDYVKIYGYKWDTRRYAEILKKQKAAISLFFDKNGGNI